MELSLASLASERHLPARRLVTSTDLGWAWPLAQVFEQPPDAEEFETPATPDLLAVMGLTGCFRLQSRQSGGWESTVYRRGTVGVTAPGSTDVLRWHGPDIGRISTLHVHLPAELVEQTRAVAVPAGRPLDLNALHRPDPTAEVLLDALNKALQLGADWLVGESLAQALTAQLLVPLRASSKPARSSGQLSDRALGAVIGYMREHLGSPVGLEDLAREAHLSKYHFLRLFTARAGVTPQRYLTDLRLERAAELLAAGEHGVTSVAALCGYASTSRFTVLFRQRHGVTPGQFRRR